MATTDGFSEGDRSQFMPAVTVDQTTGTVVVSYFDARYDASNARVAQMVTYSVDGGQSVAPSTFINEPQQVDNEATGETLTIGPIPDNESSGNASAEKTFGFGTHQGLVAYGGLVFDLWASNLNGGDGKIAVGSGANGVNLLQISTNTVQIPAGPRVLSGTSGVVAENGLGADGGPGVNSISFTLDGPVAFTLTPVYGADFESAAAGNPGSLDNWTINNNSGSLNGDGRGLWHLSTGRSNTPGHSATHSLYFGQLETANGGGNYLTNDGSFFDAGTVTSPVITLPAGGGLSLSLAYLLQTNGFSVDGDDVASVNIVDTTTGTTTTIASNAPTGTQASLDDQSGATNPTFDNFGADISQFAGHSIQIQISFDNTINFDSFTAPPPEGFYIDDVQIVQSSLPNTDVQLQFLNAQTGVTTTFNPTSIQATALDGRFGATALEAKFPTITAPGTLSYTVGPEPQRSGQDVVELVRHLHGPGPGGPGQRSAQHPDGPDRHHRLCAAAAVDADDRRQCVHGPVRGQLVAGHRSPARTRSAPTWGARPATRTRATTRSSTVRPPSST